MKNTHKLIILAILSIIIIVSITLLGRIAQDDAFHHFADDHTKLGVPNFLNVLSNLPFLITGGIGLSMLGKAAALKSVKLAYAIMFVGILLTGLGSAWYHTSPDNASLVFDRIPMTVVFMAFLSIIISKSVSKKAGTRLLFPLLLLGITSVIWWYHTELAGHGDLRLYIFVQFYPMIIIPVILLMYKSPENIKEVRILIWTVLWYVLAKILEHYDEEVYTLTSLISGHSLKHIAAAIATWYMFLLFKSRYMKKDLPTN